MFSQVKSVDYISKITLPKTREGRIASCFKETKINFGYPNDINELNNLIEIFQRKTNETDSETDNNFVNNDILGEKKNSTSLLS